MKICNVLINGNIDKILTYKIPEHFLSSVYVGQVISVPLNNRTALGIIVDIGIKSEVRNLKEITNIKYNISVLNKNSFEVIKHTSDYFLQNIGKFCSKLIPNSRPNFNIKYKILSREGASKREKEILSLISNGIERKQLLRYTTYRTIGNMVNRGLIKEIKSMRACNNNIIETIYTDFSLVEKNNITIKQKGTIFIKKSPAVYDYIRRIISNNIKNKKKTLIILPQLKSHQFLINFLQSQYNNLCFYSSALSDKDKNTSFYNIIYEKPDIIVGTGDALFLPYENISSVILLMPESAHHFHYNSMPYYNAEIVAGIFARIYSTALYIVGQTPSINLIPSIKKGRTIIVENNIAYPKTIFLNSKNPYDILTKQIIVEIKNNLNKGKHSLIIYNQLGYYPFVKCNKCNSFITCPVCNTPLTYTGKNSLYYCQKCKQYFTIKKCPECGSNNFNFSGTGIEKIATLLKKEFGESTLKMLSTMESYELKNLPKYNIILATSVIFKDLFPNLFDTIIFPSIETILNDNVIKSDWHFVSVVKYLGSFLRNKGKIILQSPLHYDFIPYLTSGKIEQYISYTLKLRKQLNLPPYFHTILIKPSRDNPSIMGLYDKIAKYESNSSIITTSGRNIVIKTKKISNFSFLKSIQQKNRFRIFVDSAEYL